MRKHTCGEISEIRVTLPASELQLAGDAIHSALEGAGFSVRELVEEKKRFIPCDEIFREDRPSMALQGLRIVEDISQAELGKRIGVTRRRVSEMENGKRPITVEIAKRLGAEYNLPYDTFL
jgi:DNA-binding XRE family transcriptional regulator